MPGLSPQLVQTLGSIGGPLLVVVGFQFLIIYFLTRKIDRLTDRISDLPADLAKALAADREENRRQIDRLFKTHSEDNKHTFAMIREVVDQNMQVAAQTIRTLQAFKSEIKAEIREIHIRLGWESEKARARRTPDPDRPPSDV
jgi:hypothetical protein